MGCSNQRCAPEEKSLISKQVLTGLEVHSTTHSLNYIFRYASLGSPLTRAQFEAISACLHLASSKAEFQQAVNEGLLGQRIYCLVVTAILLSKSGKRSKAVSLFEVYDPAATEFISEGRLKELIGDLFLVAVKVLRPLFVNLSSKEEQYFERLERCLPMAKTQAKLMISSKNEPLGKGQFVERLCEYEGGLLLSPAGLRRYLAAQIPLVKTSPK